MKIKTKKIFSLAVLVLCIAVFGLVSVASANGGYAERFIDDILDDTCGEGAWEEVLCTDEYTFTGLNTATLLLAEKQSGYNNPTGWYEAADPDNKYVLFGNPPGQVGASTTFNPGEEFGLYIDSDDGYFYSEKSENCDGEKHVRLFTCDGGYVLAFEDLQYPSKLPYPEPDWNDIVIKLTGVNLIPEFTTIAIPIASILGLLFFFNHRKRKAK